MPFGWATQAAEPALNLRLMEVADFRSDEPALRARDEAGALAPNTCLTREVWRLRGAAMLSRVSEQDREPGEGTGRQGPWAEAGEEDRADRQEGDPHVLDVQGDPRGGVQSEAYRHADPRDLVEEDGVVMGGPGGAPQERDPESSGG